MPTDPAFIETDAVVVLTFDDFTLSRNYWAVMLLSLSPFRNFIQIWRMRYGR